MSRPPPRAPLPLLHVHVITAAASPQLSSAASSWRPALRPPCVAPPCPRPAAPCSPPLLATALHWNRASPIYRAWHHVDQRWLRPLFGGRAPHAAGYRSPPPSPGKRIIQRVMGPGIMKRLGADALEAEEESTAPGSSLASSYGAASSHGPAAALRQPLLGGSGGHVVPPPSSAPGLSNAKSGKRRPDAFRLWPAALEPEVPAAEAGARSAAPPRAAAAATPPLSVRSLEALDMHPSTAVEGAPAAAPARAAATAAAALAPPWHCSVGLPGSSRPLGTSCAWRWRAHAAPAVLQSCSTATPTGWTA